MPNNNNTKLKVVKVPIPDNERIITNPPNFNNISQLYLELIENKDKIKQYIIDHKEELIKKRNTKYKCDCGGKYTRVNFQQHLKSNKHKKFGVG